MPELCVRCSVLELLEPEDPSMNDVLKPQSYYSRHQSVGIWAWDDFSTTQAMFFVGYLSEPINSI